MSRKVVFLLVLVLTVFAVLLIKPYDIGAAAPKQYKLIIGTGDTTSEITSDLERKVSAALNDGWSLAGGVDSGRFQAVVK